MTISLEGGREMVVSIIFFERNAEQTTMRVLRGNGITVNLVCGGGYWCMFGRVEK